MPFHRRQFRGKFKSRNSRSDNYKPNRSDSGNFNSNSFNPDIYNERNFRSGNYNQGNFRSGNSRSGNFSKFSDNQRYGNSQRKHTHTKSDISKRHYHSKHGVQLTEKDVGITEFINPSDGFHAVIKARFSDFHVNEINLGNEVAKLTDTKGPEDFLVANRTDNDPEGKCPTELIPEKIWNSIKALADRTNDQPVYFDVTNLTKEDRTVVHKAISKSFPHKVVTNTLTAPTGNGRSICVRRWDKVGHSDRREEWPKDKGEYVHFLVYKENLDTLDVCMQISHSMKMGGSAFLYAGVKDKRAKTTQWFSVRKVNPFKLLRRTRDLKNIQVGNFTFKSEPLKLGQLSGNRFRIALRNVLADDEVIKASVDSLENNGFINYYGLQRFGNDKEVPTYEIGKQLLLGNWKEACSLILKVKKGDDPYSDVTKAKQVYSDTKDANKAYESFDISRNKCVESHLLSNLARLHANDFVNALEKIPRNMRLLYIHSFQSLIWNIMVSKRIQLYGVKPVVGDLVLIKTKTSDEKSNNENNTNENISDEKNSNESTSQEKNTSENTSNENISNDNGGAEKSNDDEKRNNENSIDEKGSNQNSSDKKNNDDEKKNTEDSTDEKGNNETTGTETPAEESQNPLEEISEVDDGNEDLDEAKLKGQEVKILEEKDLEQYSIYDIVLPLPGYNIVYPENMKSAYKELLEEHGFTLEMPKLKVKTYSLSGVYRKVFGKVKDFSWKIMYYDHPEYNLINSDFEEIKKVPEPKSIEGGKYKALILNFSLNSSNYATMVLRDILKHDTSSSSQAKLNDYHKNKPKESGESQNNTEGNQSDNTKTDEATGVEAVDENMIKLDDSNSKSKKRPLEDQNEAQPQPKLAKVEDKNDKEKERKIDDNTSQEMQED